MPVHFTVTSCRNGAYRLPQKPQTLSYVFTILLVAQLRGFSDPTRCAHDMLIRPIV